jgi:hypothetical protein
MCRDIYYNEHGKLFTELDFLENGDTTIDYRIIPCAYLSSVLEKDPSNGVLELLVSFNGGAGKISVHKLLIRNDSELYLSENETLLYKFMNEDYSKIIEILIEYNYDRDRSQYLMTEIDRKL